MRVAVVTPYFKEPASWLGRCIKSVRDQTHPATHFVVSDGHPQSWLDDVGVRHLRLGRGHADFGNTPRCIGGLLAAGEGFDAIAFLDGDNWFAPDHVERCVEAAADGRADYVTAMRHWARADGSVIDVRVGEDLDGTHVDTSCYFLLPGSYHTIARWGLMGRAMAIWCDRFYLASLRAERLVERGTHAKTVYYLCTWAKVYESIGEPPPGYAKGGLPLNEIADWYRRLTPRDRELVWRKTGYRVPEDLAA